MTDETRARAIGMMPNDNADAVDDGDVGITVLAGALAHAAEIDDADAYVRITFIAVGTLQPLNDIAGGSSARIPFAFLDGSCGVPGSLVGDGLGGCDAAAGSFVAGPAALGGAGHGLALRPSCTHPVVALHAMRVERRAALGCMGKAVVAEASTPAARAATLHRPDGAKTEPMYVARRRGSAGSALGSRGPRFPAVPVGMPAMHTMRCTSLLDLVPSGLGRPTTLALSRMSIAALLVSGDRIARASMARRCGSRTAAAVRRRSGSRWRGCASSPAMPRRGARFGGSCGARTRTSCSLRNTT